MPKFGKESLAHLATLEPRLRSVFERVILDVDCKVLEGHRGQQAQDRAFAEGRSKLKWPNGNHNSYPSRAADVAPYPIDWGDKGDARQRTAASQRFCLFAGYVLATAAMMDVKLRWGGDWDSDWDLSDERFRDLVHFELVD
jgi:peptidoglycan L-alanyl-D-glutamate endopeptidase CwlK